MGLDTTHDCWRGAYSGFSEFRELVGRAAGLPYRKSDDQYGFDRVIVELDIDWYQIADEQIMGDWSEPPCVERVGYDPPLRDPVLYLLIHSDCEGRLRHAYLKELKTRLEELEPRYDELAHGNRYCAPRLRQFIEGLALAMEKGDDVEFH